MVNISKKVNKFYNGYYSIIVFCIATTIFGLIQIILFWTDNLSINGIQLSESTTKQLWVAMFTTLISLISCYTGFLGSISNIRGNNTFLLWICIQLTLLATVAIMAGAVFAAISSLWGIVSGFMRFIIWRGGYIEKWNLSHKFITIVSFLTFIFVCILFNLIIVLFSDSSNIWSDNDSNKWMWYLDSTGATLEVCAYTFLIFKVWWAYLFFFVSKFFFGIIYGITGNGISMVQMFMFATTDISGMLAWYFLDKK